MKKDERGYFFCGGLPGEDRRQQGEGVPPMKGRAGLIGSAARYEYVSSPSAFKNKI